MYIWLIVPSVNKNVQKEVILTSQLLNYNADDSYRFRMYKKKSINILEKKKKTPKTLVIVQKLK